MINTEINEELIEAIQANPGRDYYEARDVYAIEDTEENKEEQYAKHKTILDAGVPVNGKRYAFFLV